MTGLRVAVDRLDAAIERKEPILIYGDYDVDGTMAVIILKTAIELCGGAADFHVPHRIREGSDMRDDVIERAAAAGIRLIVSVDTADYSLLSVYPNPFNSEARITYDLESRGRVQLDLYNLEGRLVRALSDEIQDVGRHERRFSGAGLSSGIYFARLTTPLRTRTQKIVLLK